MLNGEDGLRQEKCFKFGANIGIAFQLIDDVLDYISDSQALGKSAFADLKEGNVTGPVLFILKDNLPLEEKNAIQKIIKRDKITDEDVKYGKPASPPR